MPSRGLPPWQRGLYFGGGGLHAGVKGVCMQGEKGSTSGGGGLHARVKGVCIQGEKESASRGKVCI